MKRSLFSSCPPVAMPNSKRNYARSTRTTSPRSSHAASTEASPTICAGSSRTVAEGTRLVYPVEFRATLWLNKNRAIALMTTATGKSWAGPDHLDTLLGDISHSRMIDHVAPGEERKRLFALGRRELRLKELDWFIQSSFVRLSGWDKNRAIALMTTATGNRELGQITSTDYLRTFLAIRLSAAIRAATAGHREGRRSCQVREPGLHEREPESTDRSRSPSERMETTICAG